MPIWILSGLLPLLSKLIPNALKSWFMRKGSKIFTGPLTSLAKLLSGIWRKHWRVLLLSAALLSAGFLAGWKFHPPTLIEGATIEILRPVPIHKVEYIIPGLNCDNEETKQIAGISIDELIVQHLEVVHWKVNCLNSLWWADRRLDRINTGHGDQR